MGGLSEEGGSVASWMCLRRQMSRLSVLDRVGARRRCRFSFNSAFRRDYSSVTYLFKGKPRPNIPADPVSTTDVFVSLIAAKYCSCQYLSRLSRTKNVLRLTCNRNPAMLTSSLPIVPQALVPVVESP